MAPAGGGEFLVTTTSTLESVRIVRYLGIVSGEAILGANIFKDFFAGIRDIIGGGNGGGNGGGMQMVTAAGTAIVYQA